MRVRKKYEKQHYASALLLILRISASSALSALVSQASVSPLSGGGDSRTGTHQNEQSVGAADCVAITLRIFANRCHVRRWKPLVTSLETRLSPKASVSAAICCALLHSEPTISEIRAVFVALPNHGFRAYLQHRFPASDYLSVLVAFFCACVTVNQCMTLRTVPPERVSMPE